MKYSFFTVLSVLFCITINAKTFIKGKVIEKNGNPLSRASVHLPNQGKGVICNKEVETSLSEKLTKLRRKIPICTVEKLEFIIPLNLFRDCT